MTDIMASILTAPEEGRGMQAMMKKTIIIKEDEAYRKNGILVHPKVRYGFPDLPWPHKMAIEHYPQEGVIVQEAKKCPHCGREIDV